jgi:hypothetical protein
MRQRRRRSVPGKAAATQQRARFSAVRSVFRGGHGREERVYGAWPPQRNVAVGALAPRKCCSSARGGSGNARAVQRCRQARAGCAVGAQELSARAAHLLCFAPRFVAAAAASHRCAPRSLARRLPSVCLGDAASHARPLLQPRTAEVEACMQHGTRGETPTASVFRLSLGLRALRAASVMLLSRPAGGCSRSVRWKLADLFTLLAGFYGPPRRRHLARGAVRSARCECMAFLWLHRRST